MKYFAVQNDILYCTALYLLLCFSIHNIILNSKIFHCFLLSAHWNCGLSVMLDWAGAAREEWRMEEKEEEEEKVEQKEEEKGMRISP